MKPSNDEIKLMDKILLFLSNKRENRGNNKSVFAKEFNVSSDEAQNAFNKVCQIGHDENILVAQKTGYGNYLIVSKNYLEINNFISQGGFERYFQNNYENPSTTESTFTLINTGIIQSVTQTAGDNNTISSKMEKNDFADNHKPRIRTFLEILYWVAGIVGTGITIYVVFFKK